MAAKLSIADVLSLPNCAVKIPRLGFGVYLSHNQQCVKSSLAALKAGYRHIDSAQYYANEKEVGQAVQQSGLNRPEVFITTKILSATGSPEKTYQKVLESVHTIDGTDGYVDLFLVHSPNGGAAARKEMYMALERLFAEGRAKSIGVSNWGVGHIEELKSYAKVWPPHVNQLEREIVSYCHKNGIVVEAYSPLVRNQKANDPMLKAIAKAHGKTTAQVLIRYCLQKDWVPLPKSDTPSRIVENADVYDFELGVEDMARLDGLDQGARGSIVQTATNTL
ncbi:hypothetical protein BP6252_02151 [Coleophoma cylindrospora]|uniref:NADP-dependent oxidoreductase domain-containing protein n=1 Tax=Coleophoma cylindrospora TaxID=1849047 RepID=A0A3D8SEF1_9HELO|nr:hypothetical protein BP6252_02151 [Coleophoma cylindrospora]